MLFPQYRTSFCLACKVCVWSGRLNYSSLRRFTPATSSAMPDVLCALGIRSSEHPGTANSACIGGLLPPHGNSTYYYGYILQCIRGWPHPVLTDPQR
jgi:hypothetical protein